MGVTNQPCDHVCVDTIYTIYTIYDCIRHVTVTSCNIKELENNYMVMWLKSCGNDCHAVDGISHLTSSGCGYSHITVLNVELSSVSYVDILHHGMPCSGTVSTWGLSRTTCSSSALFDRSFLVNWFSNVQSVNPQNTQIFGLFTCYVYFIYLYFGVAVIIIIFKLQTTYHAET